MDKDVYVGSEADSLDSLSAEMFSENGMVELNFSCEGTRYFPVSQFLEKGRDFWFGG